MFCRYPKDKIIYKGCNRPFLPLERLLPFRGHLYMEEEISFDRSLYYGSTDIRIVNDLSKIMGFSCHLSNHKESYRLAIHPEKDKIKVYPYIYKNGERFDYAELCEISYDQIVKFRIICNSDKVCLTILEYEYGVERIKAQYITDLESIPYFVKTCGIYIGGHYKNGKDWKPNHDMKFTRYKKRKVTNRL